MSLEELTITMGQITKKLEQVEVKVLANDLRTFTKKSLSIKTESEISATKRRGYPGGNSKSPRIGL